MLNLVDDRSERAVICYHCYMHRSSRLPWKYTKAELTELRRIQREFWEQVVLPTLGFGGSGGLGFGLRGPYLSLLVDFTYEGQIPQEFMGLRVRARRGRASLADGDMSALRFQSLQPIKSAVSPEASDLKLN